MTSRYIVGLITVETSSVVSVPDSPHVTKMLSGEMEMKRREFVQISALGALHFFVQGCDLRSRKGNGAPAPSATPGPTPAAAAKRLGFGPLIERPGQLLDLPEGFEYVVVQKAGDTTSDGHRVPPQPDGMACLSGPNGEYILLRNHELGDVDFMSKRKYDMSFYAGDIPQPRYADATYGGVMRVVIDPAALGKDLKQGAGRKASAVVSSNFVLTGTDVNCAGGLLGDAWVTCEESSRPGHGYAFITQPTDASVTTPRRVDSWGRLHREAIAHDPESGVVYMTEDRKDGCFYRFVPVDKANPTGPGRLEALAIDGVPNTSPYPLNDGTTQLPSKWSKGQSWAVKWVPVADPSADKQSCRSQAHVLGGSRFMRGEGIVWDRGGCWFSASLGGPVSGGQIFEYRPDPANQQGGQLHLRYEVADRRELSCPDNLVMTPWNELLLAEDNYYAGPGFTHQHVRVMNRDGQVYDLARNRHNFPERQRTGAEFTGACFSPDGKVLFVNVQGPENVTVAITGPWKIA